MADRSWLTVFIPTPLIFRYHLPLNLSNKTFHIKNINKLPLHLYHITCITCVIQISHCNTIIQCVSLLSAQCKCYKNNKYQKERHLAPNLSLQEWVREQEVISVKNGAGPPLTCLVPLFSDHGAVAGVPAQLRPLLPLPVQRGRAGGADRRPASPGPGVHPADTLPLTTHHPAPPSQLGFLSCPRQASGPLR